MSIFEEKLNAPKRAGSPRATETGQLERPHEVSSVLHLQRTIGNQAMRRLLQANAGGSKIGLTAPISADFGNDFGEIPLNLRPRVPTHETLPINDPEKYEEEANRTAEQLIRIPEPGFQPGKRETLPTTRVQGIDGGQVTVPPIVSRVIDEPGRPLEPATRAFMESRLGHDFSQVRVHTDHKAAESSRSVSAVAYTVGKHLVFGASQYQPETPSGRALLAHELTHVTQQRVSKPFLQRLPIPGWNFTPSDFGKLQSGGNDLTISQDSSWFPSKLQDNLLNTLRFLLGPKISPRGTEGVNVLDFFHGHVVVDKKDLLLDWEGKKRPPEQAMKHAEEFERQEKLAAAKTLGGKVSETRAGPYLSFGAKYPVTASNLPGFTKAIEKLLPAFGNVLEEGAKVPGAAVMYHTFELNTPGDLAAKGQKLDRENPRRHYVTPLDTNAPRQYTPPPGGYEKEYVVIAPFSFLVDTNGAVHVRPFLASAGSGFTSLELSTVTGTPFPGEPFSGP